jgi:hypothetical protein
VGKSFVCSQHCIKFLLVLWFVSKIQETVGTYLGIGFTGHTEVTDRLHAACSQQIGWPCIVVFFEFCSEALNIN